jgi:hypothetical protein
MKLRYFYLLLIAFAPVLTFAQTTPAPPMNLPKDAPVNVTIADAKTGNLVAKLWCLKAGPMVQSFRGFPILQVSFRCACQMAVNMIFIFWGLMIQLVIMCWIYPH